MRFLVAFTGLKVNKQDMGKYREVSSGDHRVIHTVWSCCRKKHYIIPTSRTLTADRDRNTTSSSSKITGQIITLRLVQHMLLGIVKKTTLILTSVVSVILQKKNKK